MANPERLLRLLQLFSHRRVVTMDAIENVCAIPERSAYRYLNALSEANIPIYFDRQLGGYCLVNSIGFHLDDMCVQEVTLLTSCLRLMQQHVNDDYRREINSVLGKLLARQSFALESTQGNVELINDRSHLDPDHSEALSLLLVQTAIQSRRAILLSVRTLHEAVDGQITIELEEPRLQFDRKWLITGNELPDAQPILIGEIGYIHIK